MSEEESADERWIGRTLDERYRIVGRLGDGGMGSVFEAEHLALEKRVALKVIHPELVRDEEALARFEREARATAAVEHPHVASATDFGRLPEGGAYLVVRLVAGGLSLRQRIEAGPVAWREACTIGAQVADALSAIHARGFVHRDLTAENVMLTTNEDGTPFVHVLDLGVAGVVETREGERLTEEGHVVGTPGYMSPEQALGQPTDARADLYSLGVLLWEMCTGRSLWGARELTQIVACQLTEEPPIIPQLSSATAPPELATLIHRLLARTPADRPSEATAVRDALRRFAAMSSVIPVIHRFGLPVAALAGMTSLGIAGLALLLVALFFHHSDPDSAAGARSATRRCGDPRAAGAEPDPERAPAGGRPDAARQHAPPPPGRGPRAHRSRRRARVGAGSVRSGALDRLRRPPGCAREARRPRASGRPDDDRALPRGAPHGLRSPAALRLLRLHPRRARPRVPGLRRDGRDTLSRGPSADVTSVRRSRHGVSSQRACRTRASRHRLDVVEQRELARRMRGPSRSGSEL